MGRSDAGTDAEPPAGVRAASPVDGVAAVAGGPPLFYAATVADIMGPGLFGAVTALHPVRTRRD